MTDKRFNIVNHSVHDGIGELTVFGCCDELNRLYEENESLKEENKFLRNKVATYKKGNALLKSTLDKEWK